MKPFEPLVVIDDGAWLLSPELTLELFLAILSCMPTGMAVGAGGLAMEMLKACDDDVKKTMTNRISAPPVHRPQRVERPHRSEESLSRA
jgi:hypothetical protein